MTVLVIAGHGKLKNGGFDPGATGIISKGEHKYMKENLFPAMKKFLPDGADVVFFSDYKVLDYGNVVALANKYGKDTAVVECHYDASNDPSAKGGHVIVNKDFAPDKLDLRLRDAIAANVGVRYTHKGEKGISGRDKSGLGNVRMTTAGGVNYRLIELGFGTNKADADVILNHTEAYAKSLVEAILNKDVSGTPKKTESKTESKPASSSKKSTNAIAKEVIAGKWGDGADRESKLKKAGYNPDTIQKEVNSILGAGSTKKASTKSINAIAKEVIAGKWGNGDAREDKLKKAGYDPDKVQDEVNKIYGVGSSTKKSSGKSIEQMAKEIVRGVGIPQGHEARRKHFGIDADTYEDVRKRVNELL
jgi:CW_7 repeat/N-acetylmuramoyl-L-alanine amidase